MNSTFILQLEEAKSFKTLFVIKDICSWLQTFHPSNPAGSQQHISLITNSLTIWLSLSSINGT